LSYQLRRVAGELASLLDHTSRKGMGGGGGEGFESVCFLGDDISKSARTATEMVKTDKEHCRPLLKVKAHASSINPDFQRWRGERRYPSFCVIDSIALDRPLQQ
jgi:hypothetical protein